MEACRGMSVIAATLLYHGILSLVFSLSPSCFVVDAILNACGKILVRLMNAIAATLLYFPPSYIFFILHFVCFVGFMFDLYPFLCNEGLQASYVLYHWWCCLATTPNFVYQSFSIVTMAAGCKGVSFFQGQKISMTNHICEVHHLHVRNPLLSPSHNLGGLDPIPHPSGF